MVEEGTPSCCSKRPRRRQASNVNAAAITLFDEIMNRTKSMVLQHPRQHRCTRRMAPVFVLLIMLFVVTSRGCKMARFAA